MDQPMMPAVGEEPQKVYIVRHDPVRERRGLKSWAVFEVIDPEFSQGISDHHTLHEALAAKAALEAHGGSSKV